MTPSRIFNRATPYLFLAPAAIVLVVALLYPIGYLTVASFFDWRMGTPFADSTFNGIDNYLWILKDPNFRESFGVTMTFAFTVVVLEMFVGVGLALLLERPIRGMSVFRTIFILPMMIAPIVVGLIWRYMYNPQFGILNKTLKEWGLPAIPWLSSPDWALPSVIIADIWQWTPFIFILSLAALQSLSKSALEAARIDGASEWQQIIHIKLPLMMPVLVVAALLRMIDAFKVLEVIFIMTNGGPGLSTEILSLQIYKTAFVSWELGRAAALSNFLLAIVLVITIAMFLYTKIRDARLAKAQAAAEAY
ncbi:MAG: sugar ABC transporter permease [Desulfosarcinaceae bacterium]|nr:sugar ABC transporter permease [Desulfosarcinaceae bacterium]